jgi:hypothetical protein
MSSNCKRRGAALGSATGDALGIDDESDDLPRDRRLCRESGRVGTVRAVIKLAGGRRPLL